MSAIVRPCPTHVAGCPCISDDPFANLSSESPDPADVIRMGYKAANPPINAPENYWDVPFGLGSCSNADAQDAQDCADGEATREVDANQGTFRSAARTCSVPCPDGSNFSYTLKAGAVTAATQALADYLAASVCLYRAQQAQQCGPTAVTGVATDINDDSATIAGTVNPNGAITSVFFEWGTSTSYGNITPIVNIGSGTVAVPVTASLTGLTPGTTYHFRIVAINSKGTNRGADATFATTLSLSPLAWWKMDELGNGNRFDVINGFVFAPTVFSPGFTSFSGVPGKISLATEILSINDPAPTSNAYLENTVGLIWNGISFEFCFWAKFDSCVNATMDLWTINFVNYQLRFWYDSDNPGQMFMEQPFVTTAAIPFDPIDGQYHFYRIFIHALPVPFAGVEIDNNGVILGNIFTTGDPGQILTYQLLIGSGSHANNSWQVAMDELAVFDVELSSDQLNAIYNGGAGITWPL